MSSCIFESKDRNGQKKTNLKNRINLGDVSYE